MTEDCGFRQLQIEKCMYIKRKPDGSYMLVCMYVDDLVIAYSDTGMLDSFTDKIKTRFKITTENLGFSDWAH